MSARAADCIRLPDGAGIYVVLTMTRRGTGRFAAVERIFMLQNL
jgi:hypothetical protein